MSLMKNKYVGVLGVVAGVAMVAALTAVALGAQQGPPPGRGPGGQGGHGGPGFGMMGRGPGGPMGGMIMQGLRQLNLTEEQKTQVKAVMDANKDALQAIGKQMQEAQVALGDAATADQPNEQAIRDAAAAVGKLQGDLAVLRSQIHTKVFALLTPDQQAQAKQFRADAKSRGGQGRGMMGRGGRGRGPGRGGFLGWL